MRLSILIPTLEDRGPQFEGLWRELTRQTRRNQLEDEVEILFLRDAGQASTGHKRNLLLRLATGDFVVFVDDDDEVHRDFVRTIVAALRAHPHVDVLGIRGTISFRGAKPRRFVMSTRYPGYRTQRGWYTRPPHHLNPMRRDIAVRFEFEDVSRNEDSDWALQISRQGALRDEHMLETPLYHYRSRKWWPYQRLLDSSEFIRHPLGIQLVNRLRLRRWLREAAGRHSRTSGPAPVAEWTR